MLLCAVGCKSDKKGGSAAGGDKAAMAPGAKSGPLKIGATTSKSIPELAKKKGYTVTAADEDDSMDDVSGVQLNLTLKNQDSFVDFYDFSDAMKSKSVAVKLESPRVLHVSADEEKDKTASKKWLGLLLKKQPLKSITRGDIEAVAKEQGWEVSDASTDSNQNSGVTHVEIELEKGDDACVINLLDFSKPVDAGTALLQDNKLAIASIKGKPTAAKVVLTSLFAQ